MISRARLNKKNADGLALVHLAAKNHHIEQLTILKKLRASFKIRTNDGETPLLLICKHMPSKKVYTSEEMRIIDLLTHNKRSNNVNVPDEKGYSPLHYAARSCSGRAIEKLIRLGAKVNDQANKLHLAPLHCAVQSSRLDAVDALIRHGARVNPVAIDGVTPLHLAVASSTVRIAEYLIDVGAKINYLESSHLYSPMHVALLNRRRDMFELLARSGANVNVASRNGVVCLHLAAMCGDVEIVERLIQLGAFVNCREKSRWITPLHVALSRGRAPKIVHDGAGLLFEFLRPWCAVENPNYAGVFFCLLRNGADVRATSNNGKNAFHFALEARTIEADVIRVLLDSEIDVNAKERGTQLTPLLVATREGLDEAIEKLIEAGADVKAVTEDGKSSLHFAVESCVDALRIARLLLRHGADVDCKERKLGFTPLHAAAGRKRSADVIRELINAGADVEAVTKDGRSALHLAAESGDPDNAKILLGSGVVAKRKDVFGYTALHSAAIKARTEVIVELVNAGVDVNAKDASGKTALHLATCYRGKMTEMLVERGAHVDLEDNENRAPLHYAIRHDNESALRALIRSGGSINDTLLCRKFRVESVFDKRDVGEFVMKHLMELEALGFPIADAYGKYVTQDDLRSVYYKNCVNEVIMLKTHLIDGKVTLYDFLRMDPDDRFAYAKNMSTDVDTKFRIYKYVVQSSCREAVQRKVVLEPARLALNWLFGKDLPASSGKRIFSFLKSWHLRRIVEAVENEKGVRELLKTKVCSIQ